VCEFLRTRAALAAKVPAMSHIIGGIPKPLKLQMAPEGRQRTANSQPRGLSPEVMQPWAREEMEALAGVAPPLPLRHYPRCVVVWPVCELFSTVFSSAGSPLHWAKIVHGNNLICQTICLCEIPNELLGQI